MSYFLLRFFSRFLLFACIYTREASSSSSSETSDLYTEHCSPIVPYYNITAPTNGQSLPSLSTTYFTGWHRLLRAKPGRTYHHALKDLKLRLSPDHYKTTAAAVYKVHGFLTFRFPYKIDAAPVNYSYSYSYRQRASSIAFSMNGFWSETSRILCMVGSGKNRDAVLKLKFDQQNPTIHTSVVSGSLESTASANDLTYFDSISILSFPQVSNYSYSEEIGGAVFPSRRDESSLSLGAAEFCSVLLLGLKNLELEYASECVRGEPHGCSPFGFGDELLPSFLYLTSIQCFENVKKGRFMAIFQNHTSYGYDNFAPGSAVIGELFWDEENKRMNGVACRILNTFGNAVGDCTMRFSLRYPAVLTIGNDARIVGEIWSSKSVGDWGYFRKIKIASSDENGVVALRGLRYEYSGLDRAKKYCNRKAAKEGNVYPDGQSSEMKFDVQIMSNKEEVLAWGYAIPAWVGNRRYRGSNMLLAFDSNSVETDAEFVAFTTKMSYKMWIRPLFQANSSIDWVANPYRDVEVSGEGEYDGESGYLCMVGCRRVVWNSSYVVNDCEVAVELEFAPLNGGRDGLVKGTIRSTRATTDPLHFDRLVLQSAPRYVELVDRYKWLMDLSGC